MRIAPKDPYIGILGSSWWNWRCGQLGGGVSLRLSFEISDAIPFPAPPNPQLLLVDQDVLFQLLLQHRVCLPPAMLPVVLVMDSNTLKL